MAIRYLFIAICVVSFIGCFHGHCYRSIEGTIKTDLQVINLNVKICRDYGSGYGSNCDVVKKVNNGTYKLTDLPIDPQGDCKNDCSEKNISLPIKIGVKIYKTTANGDSILKEVDFSCEKDYSFSGDDIQLPEIELP